MMEEDAHGHVVRDPKAHPDAVLTDFMDADPLITFDLKGSLLQRLQRRRRFQIRARHATRKNNAWATKELTTWKTTSPWRMTQPLM